MEGAGGTAGGIGSFLVGFIMAVAGGYLITQHVQVSIADKSSLSRHAYAITADGQIINILRLGHKSLRNPILDHFQIQDKRFPQKAP